MLHLRAQHSHICGQTICLLIVPFCDIDASILFRICSLAVCFAVDVCTLQTAAVANWDYTMSCMQQVLCAGMMQLQDRGIGSS